MMKKKLIYIIFVFLSIKIFALDKSDGNLQLLGDITLEEEPLSIAVLKRDSDNFLCAVLTKNKVILSDVDIKLIQFIKKSEVYPNGKESFSQIYALGNSNFLLLAREFDNPKELKLYILSDESNFQLMALIPEIFSHLEIRDVQLIEKNPENYTFLIVTANSVAIFTMTNKDNYQSISIEYVLNSEQYYELVNDYSYDFPKHTQIGVDISQMLSCTVISVCLIDNLDETTNKNLPKIPGVIFTIKNGVIEYLINTNSSNSIHDETNLFYSGKLVEINHVPYYLLFNKNYFTIYKMIFPYSIVYQVEKSYRYSFLSSNKDSQLLLIDEENKDSIIEYTNTGFINTANQINRLVVGTNYSITSVLKSGKKLLVSEDDNHKIQFNYIKSLECTSIGQLFLQPIMMDLLINENRCYIINKSKNYLSYTNGSTVIGIFNNEIFGYQYSLKYYSIINHQLLNNNFWISKIYGSNQSNYLDRDYKYLQINNDLFTNINDVNNKDILFAINESFYTGVYTQLNKYHGIYLLTSSDNYGHFPNTYWVYIRNN